MSKAYHIVDKTQHQRIAQHLVKDGQLLLPFVDLVEHCQTAVDELIDVMGRASIEAVLLLSAQSVAGGPPHPGRRGGEVVRYGAQNATVPLSDRKLRVRKPRLRRKGQGPGREVQVPAYEAMLDHADLGQRMLEILMAGVSTRQYKNVIPQMADTVGVSKSAVSREFVAASEEQLKELCERPLEDLDLLVIYLDGLVFGKHHVLTAVGVDTKGYKHVLGLAEGGSENATVAEGLLQDLVQRGVKPEQKYLFVIDGSKALRRAIDVVFGAANEVQRCRQHKIRNVLGYLPRELQDQVRAAMRAAYNLDWREGMARLRKQAEWLEREHPQAAASLREGLEETFTVNRLGLSGLLRRCLGTTNIIENPHGGVRSRTRRVTRWEGGKMALRWAAAGCLAAEARFKRIMGYKELWMLESALGRKEVAPKVKVS